MATITPANDPGYKYSVARFTGNGGKTDWDFNFAGGYVRREHIKAYTLINGVYNPLAYTWVGDNTVRITPAVASGVALVIRRETPKDIPLVDFTDGAIINERNLDTNAQQSVFVAAEMVDAFGDVTVESAEAVAIANGAALVAAGAVQTANSADAKANTAITQAGGAVSTAGAANAKADQAVSAAAGAVSAAGGAVTTANEAKVQAAAADGKATSAQTIANTAAGQSSSAVTTAQGANTKADTALARSLAAQDVAAQATITAGDAKTTAQGVRTEFDALAETVEEIAGGDLTNFVRVTQENTFQKTQRFQSDAGPPIEVLTTDGTEGFRLGARGAISFRRAGVWETAVGMVNDWNAVYNKPAAFTPAAHTHVVGDVTGLQGALDAKATTAALTTGLAGKVNKSGDTISGPLIVGGVNSNSFVFNAGAAEITNSIGPYLDFKLDYATDFDTRIQMSTADKYIVVSAPGMRIANAGATQGNVILTGANQGDAVLKSATNLGKVNAGPLRVVDGAVMDAAPLGYSVMTAPGSTTPGGSYGYFFKTGLRDNSAGWSGLWHSHGGAVNRMFIGYSDGVGTTPRWNEVATLNLSDTTEQAFNGVQKFVNGSRPGMEIWHPDGRGLRFGPAGGISFATGGVWEAPDASFNLKNFARQNTAVTFGDITTQRGDGSGAIFLGGGAYLYHNTAGEYEFGGNKSVNTNNHFKLTQPWNRVIIAGAAQPKITVSAAEPAEKQTGDLWIW